MLYKDNLSIPVNCESRRRDLKTCGCKLSAFLTDMFNRNYSKVIPICPLGLHNGLCIFDFQIMRFQFVLEATAAAAATVVVTLQLEYECCFHLVQIQSWCATIIAAAAATFTVPPAPLPTLLTLLVIYFYFHHQTLCVVLLFLTSFSHTPSASPSLLTPQFSSSYSAF